MAPCWRSARLARLCPAPSCGSSRTSERRPWMQACRGAGPGAGPQSFLGYRARNVSGTFCGIPRPKEILNTLFYCVDPDKFIKIYVLNSFLVIWENSRHKRKTSDFIPFPVTAAPWWGACLLGAPCPRPGWRQHPHLWFPQCCGKPTWRRWDAHRRDSGQPCRHQWFLLGLAGTARVPWTGGMCLVSPWHLSRWGGRALARYRGNATWGPFPH